MTSKLNLLMKFYDFLKECTFPILQLTQNRGRISPELQERCTQYRDHVHPFLKNFIYLTIKINLKKIIYLTLEMNTEDKI